MTRPGRVDLTAAGRAHRGFTLIEVLVALVIVALGMAALLGSLSSAAESAAYLRDKTFAQWVALNQIATVRLQQQPPSLGDTTGEVDLANRKWTWKQTVASLNDIPGVLSLDVSVRPSDIVPAKGSNDQYWFVTVTGVKGDSVAPSSGVALYGDITLTNEQIGIAGGPGAPGTQTPATQTPGTQTPTTTTTGTTGTSTPGTGSSGSNPQ